MSGPTVLDVVEEPKKSCERQIDATIAEKLGTDFGSAIHGAKNHQQH